MLSEIKSEIKRQPRDLTDVWVLQQKKYKFIDTENRLAVARVRRGVKEVKSPTLSTIK